MAGIESNYNFFLKKFPPELVGMQPNKGGAPQGTQGVEGVGGVGQPKEDPKVEAKKMEVARIAEDAMQELQIDESSERDLFLNDIKKKMS